LPLFEQKIAVFGQNLPIFRVFGLFLPFFRANGYNFGRLASFLPYSDRKIGFFRDFLPISAPFGPFLGALGLLALENACFLGSIGLFRVKNGPFQLFSAYWVVFQPFLPAFCLFWGRISALFFVARSKTAHSPLLRPFPGFLGHFLPLFFVSCLCFLCRFPAYFCPDVVALNSLFKGTFRAGWPLNRPKCL